MEKISLLKYVNCVIDGKRKINMIAIYSIIECIEDRIDWLEDREPESCGDVYDTWQEKLDRMIELYEIITNVYDDFKDECSLNEELLNEFLTGIKEYNDEFKGISRLSIEI